VSDADTEPDPDVECSDVVGYCETSPCSLDVHQEAVIHFSKTDNDFH
jgi:hypothetical protein